MRAIGVPTTAARTRYARAVGCVRFMRGSALRKHAAWAVFNILKDWLRCQLLSVWAFLQSFARVLETDVIFLMLCA
jgi:hypothetical protein